VTATPIIASDRSRKHAITDAVSRFGWWRKMIQYRAALTA
jgi:hypothetical protein